MRKWVVLLIVIIMGLIAYNYIYKDHRVIENESAEIVVTSNDLANQFVIDPSTSEKKYLNKTIEVEGKITEHNEFDLTLDFKIFCQFSSKITVEKNTIKVKGRFIGYDNLLEQIKLDQCSILTN